MNDRIDPSLMILRHKCRGINAVAIELVGALVAPNANLAKRGIGLSTFLLDSQNPYSQKLSLDF
jgi:hypothetical protein